jgi:hypothetical protein
MRRAVGVALILVGATFLASLGAFLLWSHAMLRVGLGGTILALLGVEGVASAACLAGGLALLLTGRRGARRPERLTARSGGPELAAAGLERDRCPP